jgi:Arm DNA-binding domain
MTAQKLSASTITSASTKLPHTNVVELPTARQKQSSPRPFTKAGVNKMECPRGRSEALFWDGSCRGFGLRILSTGRRTWIYQYRDEHKRTRRIALGDASAVALEVAREAARQHAARVTQGGNPSAERKAKQRAVSVLSVIVRSDATAPSVLQGNRTTSSEACCSSSSRKG